MSQVFWLVSDLTRVRHITKPIYLTQPILLLLMLFRYGSVGGRSIESVRALRASLGILVTAGSEDGGSGGTAS